MPPVTVQNSPDLAIVLDEGSIFVGDGTAISGSVVRKSHFVDPDASVIIRLRGRAKVKIILARSQYRRVFRSCFNFIDGASEAYKIHQGPVHIPPNAQDEKKWPFAIPLPSQPNIEALRRNNKKDGSFVPLDTTGLPPTLYVHRSLVGVLVEAYVEYHLEAILVGSSGRKRHTARQTVHVHSASSPIPITDFSPRHRSEVGKRIISPRLVPGMENAKLSVGQKLKKKLGSSQIPAYSFSLQLDFASRLQVGNPNPIPLQLRATTIRADTSAILQGAPPAIQVTRFTLSLVSKMDYAFERLMSEKVRNISPPLLLANYTWNATAGADMYFVPFDDASPPLDLGIALGIRTPISPRGAEVLFPTFRTYNMKNEKHLEWKIILQVAGETIKYEGRQPVTVMGPSYDSGIVTRRN